MTKLARQVKGRNRAINNTCMSKRRE